MKLIDLLNKIANGEIKEGTKIKIKNSKIEYKILDGDIVQANDFETYFLIGRKRLNDEVEIIEEKPQGRWKPKEGEYYWYVDTYKETHKGVWLNDNSDNWRYTTKNVFKTEEEAEEYFEYKTALLKAEKPFVEEKENYFIKLEEGNIEVGFTWASRYAEVICLGQDEEVAQAFVDKWYKQILKYEFGIEE